MIPTLGLDVVRLKPAAGEDPFVCLAVRLEVRADALLVAVERVGVFHDELAQPQEAATWTRLVPILRLKVVQELGQLPVAPDLARVERDGLLVRQRQDELATRPILEAEDLGNRDAARRLPELGRSEHGHQHLLAADRVHFLANDLLDPPVNPPPEGQERPQAGAHLADEAAANKQTVARRLGIARVFPERRDEERRRSGHQDGRWAASAIIRAAGLASLSRVGRTIPLSIHVSISRKSSSTRSPESTFLRTRPWA